MLSTKLDVWIRIWNADCSPLPPPFMDFDTKNGDALNHRINLKTWRIIFFWLPSSSIASIGTVVEIIRSYL